MNDHSRALLSQTAVRAADLVFTWEGLLISDAVPEGERPQWLEWIEAQQWAIGQVERLVPDRDLLHAYQRTDGETGDPEADALLAEIERRGLDV